MSSSVRRLLVSLIVVAVLVVAAVAWLDDGDEPAGPVAVDTEVPSASPTTPTPAPTPAPTPSPTPVKQPPKTPFECLATSDAITPTSISIAGVTTGSPVVAVPRGSNGVLGVPPVTSEGKTQFAWDQPGVAPGSPAGVALFDAHTWPDGSALGNRLLEGLQTGGRLIVRGATGEHLCYDVARRDEVTAETRMPEIYSTEGPPQLVIIVCSGVRRGPGDWSHRTLWFARPV
ncbi:class F sortase [Nocardioides sp. InS609-2]|uniref:class F sortase n=1 Tax=Nocardioides sp. InS609-2 TaxID=2760705 RepID=UPI0020BF0D0F|nr:class F sortase [Nocardioides sp. InS609-2]